MSIGRCLVVGLLGSAVLAACSGSNEQTRSDAPEAPRASGARSSAPGAHRGESLLGVVLASETVEITAPFEGRLARLTVQPGERIQAGAVLASMSLETLRSEETMNEALLEQAEAEQGRAELEANQATERLQRYLKPAPGTFSAEEISTARYQEKIAIAQAASARARTRERRAALARIRQRIAEAELRAPFDCVVAVRYLDPGAGVRPGTPVLRLLRAGGLRVRFALPEERSGAASAGLPVDIFLPALGSTLPGKVESVSPEVDAASRMVFATATLLSPSDSIRAGMVARVSLGDGATPQASPPAGGKPGGQDGG